MNIVCSVVKIVLIIVCLVGIFFSVKSIVKYFKSKSYNTLRLLSSIYFNEDTNINDNIKNFCIEKKLLNNENNKLELTEKGFNYMMSNTGVFISYLALIITFISLFITMINMTMNK